jgi:hypothetical protein
MHANRTPGIHMAACTKGGGKGPRGGGGCLVVVKHVGWYMLTSTHSSLHHNTLQGCIVCMQEAMSIQGCLLLSDSAERLSVSSHSSMNRTPAVHTAVFGVGAGTDC